MKIIKTLQLKIDNADRVIHFGTPDTEEEFSEMYKLRYEVYVLKNYIDKDKYKNALERDEYDENKKCEYFIAKLDDKIIGTVRLIRDYFLPTEKECFKFEEPTELKTIPRNQRAEIGRLVVVKYGAGLPRNLILLFLIDSLVSFGIRNNVRGGYAFIKERLQNKLEKLKIPVHPIEPFTQIYPSDGPLNNYFNNQEDKVLPVFFITREFEDYMRAAIDNSEMFTKKDGVFILNENLYNRFLKALKII